MDFDGGHPCIERPWLSEVAIFQLQRQHIYYPDSLEIVYFLSHVL